MKVLKFPQILLLLLTLTACGEIVSYPETPIVEYKSFTLYRSVDLQGNEILLGKLDIDFTDGDGDVGLNQPVNNDVSDSLKYNLFITLHELKNGELVKVEGAEGRLNYRVPYMERIGQNKTLQGTITVDIEYYKGFKYETFAYTFYLMDRAFNRSNTDTSDYIVFTGIEF